MTKSRVGGWMSTAVTIASGASAAAEIDVRGFIPLMVHVGPSWTAANIGFKGRAYNQSTSRVIYDNTGSSNPMQISGVNTTVGGAYTIPASPTLAGICFLTVYKKSTVTTTTSAVNQTGGITAKLWVEGIG